MNVLVSGGTGYIGSHTVVELLKKGHDVVVFEEVYDKNGYLVAKHADINYAPQTFRVTEEPKTGDTAMIGMCFILLMISAVGLLICIKKKGTGRI